MRNLCKLGTPSPAMKDVHSHETILPQCNCCRRYAATIHVPHRWLGCCFSSAREEEFMDLNDNGRKLCSSCCSIAIMDPKECRLLFQKVLAFYRNLDIEVDEDIPCFLVDSITMLKLVPEKVGTIGVYTDDLCHFMKIKQCLKGEEEITVHKEKEVLERPKKPASRATGIGVLFGRPNVDMGATLAHEMMHAWLRLKGSPPYKFAGRVEEGICEVMAYMWMEWFCCDGFDSSYKTSAEAQYTRHLKDYLARNMEVRECITYGQGFRDAMKAVTQFGLATTLDHIVKEGRLPC